MPGPARALCWLLKMEISLHSSYTAYLLTLINFPQAARIAKTAVVDQVADAARLLTSLLTGNQE